MNFKKYYPMAQQQYKISVNLKDNIDTITLVGFSADEESEQIICRHLYNMCKQSDGSFAATKNLLNATVVQWQNYFNVSAMQILQTATHINQQSINKVNLYKLQDFSTEKLINCIQF